MPQFRPDTHVRLKPFCLWEHDDLFSRPERYPIVLKTLVLPSLRAWVGAGRPPAEHQHSEALSIPLGRRAVPAGAAYAPPHTLKKRAPLLPHKRSVSSMPASRATLNLNKTSEKKILRYIQSPPGSKPPPARHLRSPSQRQNGRLGQEGGRGSLPAQCVAPRHNPSPWCFYTTQSLYRPHRSQRAIRHH